MPKDQRLYVTYPIDMHRHPKLSRLSVEARWAFVEMNGEARIADNDGRFSAEDAEFLWPVRLLEELATSHPARPLVMRDTDTGEYLIREYAEHQQTRAEREALSAKRAEAGRKGGKSRASGKQMLSPSEQPQAESESESESEDLTDYLQSQSNLSRATDSTDSEAIARSTERTAAAFGITSLAAIQDVIEKHTGRRLDGRGAFAVARWLLGKAKGEPKVPQRYVIRAVSLSPAEVQKHIDEAVLP